MLITELAQTRADRSARLLTDYQDAMDDLDQLLGILQDERS